MPIYSRLFNTRIRFWVSYLHEKFYIFLPLIYLGYGLPLATAFALVCPPFQAPDEFNHFFRAVQISEGHLFASRSPHPEASLNNASGGFISSGAISLAGDTTFQGLPFHSENKFNPALAERAHLFDKPWDDQVEFVSFPNTAIYPFTCYLPAAVGLTIGRWTGLSILESYFLARLLDAFISVGLSALAIHVVSRGKLIMVCVLSLPMTLFLFSSLSQDAMLISYVALAIALLNRYLDKPPAERSLWEFGAVFLFFSLSVIGRPPYLALLPMGALLVSFGQKSVKTVIVTTVFALAAIATYLLNTKYLGSFMATGASPENQQAVLLHHPIKVLSVMIATIWDCSFDFYHDFIGTLGWLDYRLPEPFYPLIGFTLIIAFISDFKFKDQVLPNWSRLVSLAFPLMAITLIFVAIFIFGNNEARAHIDGIQGRYFIPIALMLSLVAGNHDAAFMKGFPVQTGRLFLSVACLIFVIITGFAACLTTLCRYYY